MGQYLKPDSSTYDGTLRLNSYKLFFAGLLPSFLLFAFPYPLTGYSMGYYFSFAEAFMYVFGVAVPAYHMWSYGVLRTFDINAIRERNTHEVLPMTSCPHVYKQITSGGFTSFIETSCASAETTSR